MARSNWNPNSPDVVGVEFQGIGVTNNLISTGAHMFALRFTAQRTGTVNEVSLYSGVGTNNPVLSAAHFAGHRKPFIVEVIPVSGFDPGNFATRTTYLSAITASSNVVDEGGTAVEGNELQARNDGLFLFNSGSTPSQATVHMLSANTFPTNQHVLSIAIENSMYRSMNIRRIDQNGSFLWTRLFPAGFTTWHMGEAYLEAGDLVNWRLWSPQNVREFNSGVGNRRLRLNALNTQSNVMDLLRIHVDHQTERRVGVAVIEPTGTYQWVTAPITVPYATGSPMPLVAGSEYIVLVRAPYGVDDYGLGQFDWRAVKDERPGTTFQHFEALNWDLHAVTLWETSVPRAVGDLLDGLPSLRMIAGGGQTVDTQPYSASNSGAPPFKSDNPASMRPRQQITIPAGTTEYAKARVVMAVFETPTTPTDLKHVNLEIVTANTAETLVAGPFQITKAMVDASPDVGSDIYGDDYKEVTVEFGSGFDLATGDVRARFTLASDYGEPGKTSNGWRIGVIVAESVPGTGDQTAAGAATGHAFIPPSGAFSALHDTAVRRADLLVSLLSQAPEITGTAVSGLAQMVTGGVCDSCHDAPVNCTVTEIPYNRVCWSATTLTQEDFGYYEVQRREMVMGHMGGEPEWETVAIIAPTGSPVTGAPVTAATCWDDWSHMYDVEVCYRVRQQRVDGTLSDFVEEVCITTASPAGGDIVITAPGDPTFNVAFPEAYGARLPITKEWTVLDAEQHTIRAIYGRDKHIAFRPLERLGVQFQRRLLISALCTPMVPCLSVVEGIHEICQASVGTLVVRDRCSNRWYATVNVPSITQMHDPDVGDLWFADLIVTELATPVITPETVGV